MTYKFQHSVSQIMSTPQRDSTESSRERDLPILPKPGPSYKPEVDTESEESQRSWVASEIWTSPPTRLPDGSEHPFFQTCKIRQKDDPDSPQRSTSQQYTTAAPEPPSLYPFIPAPTLYCEPETLNTSPIERSALEKEDLSPRTSPKTNRGSRNSTPSLSGQESETDISTPGHGDPSASAKCRFTYARRAESDSSQRRVVQGQIWRGMSESDRPWRRNQWFLDG